MRRLVATLAAVSALMLALSASPALANSPAVHSSFDATESVFVCGDNSYTVTSGTVSVVMHLGSSASGNLNGTFTGTPKRVVAVDEDGNVYSIVGAIWSGFTVNAQTGGFQTTFTGKLQIVSQGGGTADSVNVVFHISPNGDINSFDFGTCLPPEG
jgi:uncharacterized membrane protein YoaK (UPF0700 family)